MGSGTSRSCGLDSLFELGVPSRRVWQSMDVITASYKLDPILRTLLTTLAGRLTGATYRDSDFESNDLVFAQRQLSKHSMNLLSMSDSEQHV
jgi:hypothetical protein